MWRCVLSWAKHKACVNKSAGHWTEEERTRVCQYLFGVIDHVRLLLIGKSSALASGCPLKRLELLFRQPSVRGGSRADRRRSDGALSGALPPRRAADQLQVAALVRHPLAHVRGLGEPSVSGRTRDERKRQAAAASPLDEHVHRLDHLEER